MRRNRFGINDNEKILPPGVAFVGKGAKTVISQAAAAGAKTSKGAGAVRNASRALDGFNQVLLPVAITLDAVAIGSAIREDITTGTARNTVTTGASVAGGWGGGYGGSVGGAALGTAICPGIGTIIGGVVGAIAGGFSGAAVAKAAATVVVDDISKMNSMFKECQRNERTNFFRNHSKLISFSSDDEEECLSDSDDSYSDDDDNGNDAIDRGKDTGIAHDYYPSVQQAALSQATQSAILTGYKTQAPQGTLVKKWAKESYATAQDSQYLQSYKGNPNPANNPSKRTESDYLTDQIWLHLRTPPNFYYTFGILTNRNSQGLFHAFIRHWNQFERHIRELRPLIASLPSNIQFHLRDVTRQTDPTSATNAIGRLMQTLQGLRSSDLKDVRKILLKAQLLIFNYLQKNLTKNRYNGEGVNNSGQVQVFFDVTDTNGTNEVMVIAASDQLYKPIADFNDARPVRTVTTVFFMSKADYAKYQKSVRKCFP